eukprot:CAMPEP_0171508850 /NCGR_PEP_ID=MMETSP0958-20121227/14420_1 /TAXON_ID=87120 /ORGANISM="Aurantiochytrium limacinum, Strain ATCCMYA-1381" /LENGTH=63 /DNA_ID=CAMNT_0012045977 /DNA_START=132 /DNA_END=320 /DNA_ORIENTATION=+
MRFSTFASSGSTKKFSSLPRAAAAAAAAFASAAWGSTEALGAPLEAIWRWYAAVRIMKSASTP